MTPAEFDELVQDAYEAAFEHLSELTAVYEGAYERQTDLAIDRFLAQTETLTAAWTPPAMESLTDGMSDDERGEANRVLDEAAAAILAALAAAGAAVSSPEFLGELDSRVQTNFAQEIMRNLRKIVGEGIDNHLNADQVAVLIRERLPQVIPASADMLAQTQLTALVNERAAATAVQQFGSSATKTWQSVGDNRVRAAHAAAVGQTVPVSQPFQVGGFALMYPGDPAGPLRLTARCRCRMSFSDRASLQASTVTQEAPMTTQTLYNGDGEIVGQFSFGSQDNLSASTTVTVILDDETATEETPEPVEKMQDGPPWRALLAIEGEPTEDGRMLAQGSVTWREPPLSLSAMDFTDHGEQGPSLIVGRVDRIWREGQDGNEIWGEGVFNTDEYALHIAELVANKSLNGNSIEPAVLSYELWDRAKMTPFTSTEDAMQAVMDGTPVLTVFTDAVILSTTFCPNPAIGDARILTAAGVPTISFHTPWLVPDTVTASAAGMVPLQPPAAWFADQHLQGPTPLTITDEGQVLGHVALFNSCHIGEPRGPGVCVTPPRSGMNYEIFHHGYVRTAEGDDIPVGQLTLGTTHAPGSLDWRGALRHYEDSGMSFADVRAYEDDHGIAIAGALRPDVPAAKVREARAGALSGDWRKVIDRGLEFLNALVVNVPGFPIPRPEARIVASAAGDEVVAVIAAGMVAPSETVEGMSRREYLRKIRMLTAEAFRDYPAADRKRMAKNGQAMPDGSFPIANCSDAENAIRSVGRASDPGAAKSHIRKRVRALGCTGDIFDNWK